MAIQRDLHQYMGRGETLFCYLGLGLVGFFVPIPASYKHKLGLGLGLGFHLQ